MSTQWHPLYARLLNVQLGAYYEIQPEFPVSDLPRRGDFLIVRRQEGPEPPFRGLWNNLTDWNIQEFKGPSDDAEVDDLEKLITSAPASLNGSTRSGGPTSWSPWPIRRYHSGTSPPRWATRS